jgi:hypothetical protein
VLSAQSDLTSAHDAHESLCCNSAGYARLQGIFASWQNVGGGGLVLSGVAAQPAHSAPGRRRGPRLRRRTIDNIVRRRPLRDGSGYNKSGYKPRRRSDAAATAERLRRDLVSAANAGDASRAAALEDELTALLDASSISYEEEVT